METLYFVTAWDYCKGKMHLGHIKPLTIHRQHLPLLFLFLFYTQQSPLTSRHMTIKFGLLNQHVTMHIQSMIRVRDGPERSRSLPKSHVLHQRKCLFHVAIGMCEFKQRG
jgi:hypothetical protein